MQIIFRKLSQDNFANSEDVATDGKGDRDTRRARYFVTAGKDKIVRAMAQIELPTEEGKEPVLIWQVSFFLIHLSERKNIFRVIFYEIFCSKE